MLSTKSYEPEEIYVIFERRDNTPTIQGILIKQRHEIQRAREPYSRGFKLPSTKMRYFVSFVRRTITDAFFFLFCFFQWYSHQTNGPRRSREGSLKRKFIVRILIPSEQKGLRKEKRAVSYEICPLLVFAIVWFLRILKTKLDTRKPTKPIVKA